MIKKIVIILSRVRLALIKIFNQSSQIIIQGFSNISFYTDIEVGSNSTLKVGKGLHVRKGSILAVRENATLNIGNNCFINRNTIIMARLNITIEDNVTIGPNVCIYDHDHNMIHRGGVCA